MSAKSRLLDAVRQASAGVSARLGSVIPPASGAMLAAKRVGSGRPALVDAAPRRLIEAYLDALDDAPTRHIFLRGRAWQATVAAALWRAGLLAFPHSNPVEDEGGLVHLIDRGADGATVLVAAHEPSPWPSHVHQAATSLLRSSAQWRILVAYVGSAGLSTVEELVAVVEDAFTMHPAPSILLIVGDRESADFLAAGARTSYRCFLVRRRTPSLEIDFR